MLEKLPALVIVSAFSELRDGVEWFNYTRAQLLTGTSPSILREQILAGNVLVDLRLHDKVTSARNHGTGFRAHEDKRMPRRNSPTNAAGSVDSTMTQEHIIVMLKSSPIEL